MAAPAGERAGAWVVEPQAEERRAEWAAPERAARDWDPVQERWEAAAWEAAPAHPEEEAAVPVILAQG